MGPCSSDRHENIFRLRNRVTVPQHVESQSHNQEKRRPDLALLGQLFLAGVRQVPVCGLGRTTSKGPLSSVAFKLQCLQREASQMHRSLQRKGCSAPGRSGCWCPDSRGVQGPLESAEEGCDLTRNNFSSCFFYLFGREADGHTDPTRPPHPRPCRVAHCRNAAHKPSASDGAMSQRPARPPGAAQVTGLQCGRHSNDPVNRCQ